jgi:hypothetical protein
VVVHVDAPALADAEALGQSVLENGEHLPAETSRRLACDASRVVMQHARDGRVVEVSARTRTEEGYAVDRQPDGDLRFRRPDGRPLPEVPRAPEVSGDPANVLRARHDAEGLVIQARTTTPGWLGERLDVGYAIDVLHPRCNSAGIAQNA